MKRFVLLTLVLAMVLSMAGCHEHHWEPATCESPKICNDCDATEGEPLGHTPGELVIAEVNTDALTITHNLPCSVCGEVIETKESAIGIAPVNSVIQISPDEWHESLITNIRNYGAGQSLYDYPVESDDNALLHSVVSMSQMNAVFSFQDVDGNVIPTDDREVRGNVHNIRMDAQFSNDNAKEFFMLLMVVLLSNNASLDPADANTLTAQIMSGNPVSDNGYTYAMQIISVEDHTVCVSITAE